MVMMSRLRAVAALLIGLIGLVGAIGTLSLVGVQAAGAGVSCPGTGVTLSGSHVSADWAGCDLSNDNFTGIRLANSNLGGTILQPGETVNFTNAHLGNVNFTNANLTNANLTNANLTDATLTDATLSDTNFLDATLDGVASGGITGTPVNLPSGWQLIDGYLVGPGADLANASFTDPDLTNQDLTNANLTDATLTDPTLNNTNFDQQHPLRCQRVRHHGRSGQFGRCSARWGARAATVRLASSSWVSGRAWGQSLWGGFLDLVARDCDLAGPSRSVGSFLRQRDVPNGSSECVGVP